MADPSNGRSGGVDTDAHFGEIELLGRRLDALLERARPAEDEDEPDSSGGVFNEPPLPGWATPEGIARFAARFGANTTAFYRQAQDIAVSTLGVGTSPGARDRSTDLAYAGSIAAALHGGVNLIDTSLNYRRQRSERSVGAALRTFVAEGGARDGIVVCTKGGYLVAGAHAQQALEAGCGGGRHSMAPAFIADQIERSRRNLGLETIDLYYLHNPEKELDIVDEQDFTARLRAAFTELEHAVSDGRIRYYGVATWDGLRNGALALRRLDAAARDIAGEQHKFRFLQLPYNLGMQEARTRHDETGATVLDIAGELGMTVIASATLGQGRLPVDAEIRSRIGPAWLTDAQTWIQFVRSTPGVASALVGMRQIDHVHENLEMARVPPLRPADFAPGVNGGRPQANEPAA
jgi:aryl-alcohol dehydrogenase-like predicted oxidoreductase